VKKAREIKIGVVVTLTIGLFIYGFNFLKGKNIFSNEIELYTIYNSIDNLVASNPILINGYKVGQVREITFHPDNSGRLIVKYVIHETGIPINDSTVAKIISSDLLGSKAIQLLLSSKGNPVKDKDTLSGEIQADLKDAVSREILPLKLKAEELVSSIDSVMTIFQAILNQDARQSLTSSFASIKRALATFEKTAVRLDELVESERGKISSILSKVEAISGTIAKNNDKLSAALNNIANITDSISKANLVTTIKQTNATLKATSEILDKVNRGEGSVGLLLKDEKLYRDLDSSAVSLNNLLEDMKKYPGRYFSLFGKKDKPSRKQKKKLYN
jgi:phospholipid/cholesterol/gamma-HCH transport system substrate-binding protein